MTPAQLLMLADHHQAAHQTGGSRPAPTSSGPGLLAMAAMQ
jgi:hypothetical protein